MDSPRAPSPPAALRAHELVHGYRGAPWRARSTVLAGLQLELARGTRLGLVGPNGSGKSTLLRLAAGIERVQAGHLEVLGGTPAAAREAGRIGYCPEDALFPGELRVLEALELCAGMQGLARRDARERARARLAQLGLEPHARLRLARCSRGMLRRFALAQAVVHEPELLLLDEPSAGLDARGLLAFAELLAAERARGASFVLCSHQLGDLVQHCDEIAILCNGRIEARGTPLALGLQSGELEVELSGASAALAHGLGELAARVGARVERLGPGPRALLTVYRAAEGVRA
jgi:ABC-type multidrug transport system ATPase subunit